MQRRQSSQSTHDYGDYNSHYDYSDKCKNYNTCKKHTSNKSSYCYTCRKSDSK